MLRGSEVANSFNQHCNQSPPISEILLKRSELDAVKKAAGIMLFDSPNPIKRYNSAPPFLVG